jgi:hypothetical protein
MKHEKDQKQIRIYICARCKQAGGTMVKVKDHYEHRDLKCAQVVIIPPQLNIV